MRNSIIYILMITTILVACDTEPVSVSGPAYKGSAGVFIVNEGNFMYDNASLSFYDYTSGEVQNNIFFKANQIPVGDVAQAITFSGTTGYIVINNSAKIYGFNVEDAMISGKITGFESPRFMLVLDQRKAYVSDLYARKIFIVDPEEYQITGEIDIDNHSGLFSQHAVEQMIRLGDRVYAACWSFDNKILVIDIQSDQVVDSVLVTKQPNSIVLDRNNDLWVLSDGGFTGSSYKQENPVLSCINTSTNEIRESFTFPMIADSPFNLAINGGGDTLFFINEDVFRMSISDDALPETAIIESEGKNYYCLGIDPLRSDIYLADAKDFQQPGLIYRYAPGLSLVDSFSVGIIPGDFYFTGQ